MRAKGSVAASHVGGTGKSVSLAGKEKCISRWRRLDFIKLSWATL